MWERIEGLIDIRVLLTQFITSLPDLLIAIANFVAFRILFRLTAKPLKAGMARTGLHTKLIELLIDSIYRYALFILGLVMGLDQLGVNVTAALAGIGVVGIAVGFAAQDSVANVISGFLIFWDKPFQVGSWVQVEGQYGCVSDITLRTTRIRTAKNTYEIIPNKTIIDSVLENFTKHGELRVDVPVGIAYKESIQAAREAILARIHEKLDWIRSDPAPDVVVTDLGDSSVNLMVRVWIDEAADRPKTMVNLVEEAKIALDEAGIEIPFPHLQLFVDDVESRVWKGLEASLPRRA